MLDINFFRTVVENTPLVSIDICLVHDSKMLLGKRSNEPLLGQWFTPGGRILKNECWRNCLKRVAQAELGLNITDVHEFTLMGIWDHFYPNSAVEDSISTHYVNLPHCIYYEKRPEILLDDQHDAFEWFDLSKVAGGSIFHKYMQSYASWIISRKPQ
jgi:colanic acid biosynthesis protein WcaH